MLSFCLLSKGHASYQRGSLCHYLKKEWRICLKSKLYIMINISFKTFIKHLVCNFKLIQGTLHVNKYTQQNSLKHTIHTTKSKHPSNTSQTQTCINDLKFHKLFISTIYLFIISSSHNHHPCNTLQFTASLQHRSWQIHIDAQMIREKKKKNN